MSLLPGQKAEVRERLRSAMGGLTDEQRRSASQAAIDRVAAEPFWKSAKQVMFYAARRDELDLGALLETAIQAGKTVALPQSSDDGDYQAARIVNFSRDCQPGRFGLSEPARHCANIPLNQLDLIFVPGVGFDLSGRRLGRGRGFYDRLLARASGLKCGVGFDLQLLSDPLPEESHDIRLDLILTPTRLISVSGRELKDVT